MVSEFDVLVQRHTAAARPAQRVAPVRRSTQVLTVGAADDPLEREADAVARTVIARMRGTSGPTVRRAPATGATGAAIGAAGGELDQGTTRTIESARRSGGSPLEASSKRRMEGAFGADFSSVRVHTGAQAGELNRAMSAEAFTVGNDIFFNDRPDTSRADGQRLLAHELAHTLQKGGEAQRKIRRRYLDDEKAGSKSDWIADTRNANSIGIGKIRSKSMKAIDSAVNQWAGFYLSGNLVGMAMAATGIEQAVTAWQGTKDDPGTSMRGSEAAVLLGEARQWARDIVQWKSAFATRRARHLADRRTVAGWIAEGARQTADIRLRNACEWVQSSKMRFYVVTETADNKVRGAALYGTPVEATDDDMRCYFPDPGEHAGGDIRADPLYYNAENFRDGTHVNPDKEGAGTKGWNVAGQSIVVTEEGVRDGKAAVLGTIKHEVQHDADKHQGGELRAGLVAAQDDKRLLESQESLLFQDALAKYNRAKKTKAPADITAYTDSNQLLTDQQTSDAYTQRGERVAMEEALQGYKTEYRAHFYQGDPRFDNKRHDPKKRVKHDGLKWTERQWEVFSKIKRNYSYVEEAWGGPAPTSMQNAFRLAVVAYWNPDTEGFNKYDSMRVDDLYIALDKVPLGTRDAADPTVVALLKVADRLDAHDVDYLRDRKQAVMFRAKINKHLKGGAKKALEQAMIDAKDAILTGEGIANLFA